VIPVRRHLRFTLVYSPSSTIHVFPLPRPPQYTGRVERCEPLVGHQTKSASLFLIHSSPPISSCIPSVLRRPSPVLYPSYHPAAFPFVFSFIPVWAGEDAGVAGRPLDDLQRVRMSRKKYRSWPPTPCAGRTEGFPPPPQPPKGAGSGASRRAGGRDPRRRTGEFGPTILRTRRRQHSSRPNTNGPGCLRLPSPVTRASGHMLDSRG